MIRFACLLLLSFAAMGAEKEPALGPYEEFIVQAKEAQRKRLFGKALEALDGAIKVDPKRFDAYFYKANILAFQRKSAEAIEAFTKVIEIDPKASSAYNGRGIEHFKLGNIEKSVEDFNRYLALEPRREPYHWQRGISFYYAGKYEEGKKQFELHQTVNPDDVENGVWHFLCAARAGSFEKARESMLPISGDLRVPMREIYELFRGKGSVDDVLQATKKGEPSAVELENHRFYAHLYLALYFEAKGDKEQTYEHMKRAATEFTSDHYMGDVARVHFKRLLAGAK